MARRGLVRLSPASVRVSVATTYLALETSPFGSVPVGQSLTYTLRLDSTPSPGSVPLRIPFSTLELTVYVRALPAPGPVRVLQRAQLIGGQRVDEACFVWDHCGRLVAQGVQLAGIRLG